VKPNADAVQARERTSRTTHTYSTARHCSALQFSCHSQCPNWQLLKVLQQSKQKDMELSSWRLRWSLLAVCQVGLTNVLSVKLVFLLNSWNLCRIETMLLNIVQVQSQVQL